MEPTVDQLKELHDIYAITHQVLTQRCTFHAEEFEFMTKVIALHKEQFTSIRKKIEELEAPKEEVKTEEIVVS